MVIVRGPVEFDMGDNDIPADNPRHRERIGHSFAIAAKEVTVEQFQRFLKENTQIQFRKYELFSPEPTCPMNWVSWYDAAAYCNWLSRQEGLPEDQWCYSPNEKRDYAEGMKLMSDFDKRKGCRLPTEAEWEYSCRAGAVTKYSFGEPWELRGKYGWYSKKLFDRTQPVGRLKPNDLGLFDLHGNVCEWCQDDKKFGQEARKQFNIMLKRKNEVPRMLRGRSFGLDPIPFVEGEKDRVRRHIGRDSQSRYSNWAAFHFANSFDERYWA